ncbi:hypothetical protein O181_065148 [Austropuccinia psidii MF-1]|uniref:Integrase catalytic domain-containing protein n=1 Tax=Austropuccinia psidii MF-1 TaxID=1389203 RepID=A0A9Q3EUU8_9BASI|nr:hypothetical protein [Austropuccinia psidii MF-1]
MANGKTLLNGEIINQLMNIKYDLPTTFLMTANGTLPWHGRLGHPGPDVLKSLGLSNSQTPCLICETSKYHRLAFNHHFTPASKSLDSIHIDVVGPITPPSISGFRYLLRIVDQSTFFKIIKFLKRKSESFDQFTIVINYMENQQDKKIKKLTSDRGGEFLNEQFKRLAENCGFIHIFSMPETPEHNGYAERCNPTILEKARCLMGTANLPNQYWAEAINTAVFLSNMSPTPFRGNKTPYQLWSNIPPRLYRLRIFGCRVVIYTLKSRHSWKPAPPGQEGVLIAFENENTSYQILRLPDLKLNDLLSKQTEATPEGLNLAENLVVQQEKTNEQTINDTDPTQEGMDNEQQASNNTGRTMIQVIGPCHPTIITADVDPLHILPYKRRAETYLSIANDAPATYQNALKSKDKVSWAVAIEKELTTMNNLNVWEVVELRKEYKIIGTTWVFKLKRDVQNNVIEHKARLCAQGFTQTPGIDFDKTYAPKG